MPPASTPKTLPEFPEAKSHEQISINFLLNSPQNDDLAGRFPTCQNRTEETHKNGGTIAPSQAIVSAIPEWCEGVDIYDAFFGADLSFNSFFDNLENLSFGAPLIHTTSPTFTTGQRGCSNMSSGLESRALEIKAHLRVAAAQLDEAHGTCHLRDLDPVIELVTYTDIETCLDLFFRHYHQHCPIIHWPTFCPVATPMPLLLAVMAVGGMYHKDASKVAWMKKMLDPMETYIYGLPGLRDEHDGSLDMSRAADEDARYHQFEIFQGAYFITVAQYFSGSPMARRRVRQQRFSRILTVKMLS